MELITVTLDQLELSPRNVRATRNPEAIAVLAASIENLGLISPLVVTRKPKAKNKYLVEAGGNRMLAFDLLVTEGKRAMKEPISVRVVEDAGQITELSLAENYAREQMKPVEVYQAFGRIKAEKPAATFEDLGAMFGYDAKRVARIMRLAGLAPEIMALYAAGEISDAQAMAFAATDDHAKQRAVHAALWQDGLPRWKQEPREIKAALKVNEQELRRVLKFVGLDAYEAAGGRATRDLFGKDDDVIIDDADILERLADEKLQGERDAFIARLTGPGLARFSWASEAPQIERYGSRQTDYELRIDVKPKLGKDDKAKLAELNARCEELCNEADHYADEHGEPTAEQHAAIEAIETEIAALENSGTISLPKSGQIVGVIKLGYEAQPEVQLFYASRADKGEDVPKGAKEVSQAEPAKTPEQIEREAEGMGRDSMDVMICMFRDMVRMQMYQTASAGSPLPLDFLVYSLARSVLCGGANWQGHATAQGEPLGVITLPDPDGDLSGKVRDRVGDRMERISWNEIVRQLQQDPSMTAEDPVIGWGIYLTHDAETKNRMAGFLAGHIMLAGTGGFQERRTPRMVQRVAEHLSDEAGFAPWRDYASLDEDFFAMLGGKRRKALLEEFGQADAARRLKASETAERCARVVNADDHTNAQFGIESDEDRGYNATWLPEFLRPQLVKPLEVKDLGEKRRALAAAIGASDELSEEEIETLAGRDTEGARVTINGRDHVIVNGVPVDEEALAEALGDTVV